MKTNSYSIQMLEKTLLLPNSFLFFLSFSLAKEEVLYIKEAKQQEEKIERLKAEAGDEYVIKKQVRNIFHEKQQLPCWL